MDDKQTVTSETSETKQLFDELVKRAEEGEEDGPEAALELLEFVLTDLNLVIGRSQALLWIFKALEQIVAGVSPARALCLERLDSKGGAPQKFNRYKIMSIDLLLRDHAKLSNTEAADIILTYFEMDPSTLRKYRKEFDSRFNKESEPLLEQSSREVLKVIAGDYIEKMEIADLLSKQTY